MKKLISACAVCAVAVAAVAAPSAMGVKSAKQVGGTVTVSGTPNPVVTGANVAATGNVASNSNCRKFRSITVQWVDGTGAPTGAPVVVQTRSNGDYTANLPAPSGVTTPTNYRLQVTVAQATRKVGGKHKKTKNPKSRQFNCLQIGPVTSTDITVNPAV
jgi:hypothetical protein